jgi:type IV secretory pathway TraG/TraD family ATPase VirD4
MQIGGITIIVVCLIAALYWFYRFLHASKLFSHMSEMVFLRVTLPRKDSDSDEKRETSKDFKEQVSLMEQLLAGLHAVGSSGIVSRFFGRMDISLEILSHYSEVTLMVVTPRESRLNVEKMITGLYSDALVEEIDEPNIFEERTVAVWWEMELKKIYFEPIKSYQHLESDPINSLFSALAKLTPTESAIIQLSLAHRSDAWQSKALEYEEKLGKGKKGFFDYISSIFHGVSDDEHKKEGGGKKEQERERIREKTKKAAFATTIRVVVTGDIRPSAEGVLSNIGTAFAQYSSPGYNTLKLSKTRDFEAFIRGYLSRSVSIHSKTVLSLEEIASLFHFPHSKYNRSAEIKWQNFKIVKAPTNVAKEWILLGTNTYQWVTKQIFLKNEDRFRHFYVIGQTGTGKTTILTVMARQDVKLGHGLAMIDPHGDFANDILPFVPKSRSDDVIFFDPSDLARPMGLNMLEASSDDEKQMVAQDALNIMIKLFGSEIFGPRIQDYFRNGVLTLMDYPGGCALTDILRLFTDDNFQMERRRTVRDPVVRGWWDQTFAKMGEREKGEIIPYFAAKFGGFITNKMMRNIIGQTKSSFDVLDCMQTSKILVMSLSKGVLGDFNSNLLGLILVSKIQMAAMRRQSIAKDDRRDFFLYIDEFQNYITDSIESILSEARKYRLGLVVAHQYLGQLQKSDALTKSNVNLKDAIFGNVGSMMSYKLGPEDAEFVSKQFAPHFSEQDIINMDKFKWITKIAIDGQPSTPFSLTPINPYLEVGNPKLARAYKEISRLKYWRDREFIEKEINFRIWVGP